MMLRKVNENIEEFSIDMKKFAKTSLLNIIVSFVIGYSFYLMVS